MNFGSMNGPGANTGQMGLQLLQQVQKMRQNGGNVGLLQQLMPQAAPGGQPLDIRPPAAGGPATGPAPMAPGGGMPQFLQNGLVGQLFGDGKKMGGMMGGQPGGFLSGLSGMFGG